MSLHPPKPKKGTTPEGIQWAYRLMEREARGDVLPMVSRNAWREVLGYSPDADAKAALEAHRAQQRKAA